MKEILEVFEFLFATAEYTDGRHRHHLHVNFTEGGKWNDSSADIPGHTRPFLLIHLCAHWHVCCFIALLTLEHLLSVPKAEKTRRRREKNQLFYLHWDMAFSFSFCLKEMRLIVGIVRAQQVLMDTPKEISGDRQQWMKDWVKSAGIEILDLLDCKNLI